MSYYSIDAILADSQVSTKQRTVLLTNAEGAMLFQSARTRDGPPRECKSFAIVGKS